MAPLLGSTQPPPGVAVGCADQVSAEVEAMISALSALATEPRAPGPPVDDATRIDRIAVLERLQHVASALQAVEMVAFGRSQVAAQRELGVDPNLLGRGIADQIALACHVSPIEGSRRLHAARDLLIDLPGTFALWAAGRIGQRQARAIAVELSHLAPDVRRSLDRALLRADLPSMSERRVAAAARRLAQRADRHGAVERARISREARRVTLRPAPDTMSLLTATVPVEQGVACWAALHRHADGLIGTGDHRSRGQIMADTLVERITGQATASAPGLDVGILIGIDTLLDPHAARPAEIVGHGPLPAALARELLADPAGRRAYRRVFTAPPGWTVRPPSRVQPSDPSGQSDPSRPPDPSKAPDPSGPSRVVGLDRRRRFDGWLADLITVRDRHCRDPFCDAPVRQIDHVRPHRSAGPTEPANGRAVCARGNLVKEMPGWRTTVLDTGAGGRPHAVVTTTPTGHVYLSRAEAPP